jgi:4-hydroxy-tetrahydrodipicolinate synthase
MSAVPLPRPLRGIVVPLVTPLRERDRLDHAGLERLIEHVLSGGVHGLFPLGTTGEGPSLSYRLRCELIERACEQAADRTPVLVGITDASFVESVELAEHAADCGACAVVLAPPYYFPAAQAELADYVERIAADLPLPVFLYNIPSLARNSFDATTVARAVQLPNVVGLKDSTGSMINVHTMTRHAASRPDFSVLVGPEELLAESVLFGAHGGVNGGANMFPRLYVDLYDAATSRDLPRARELHDRVMRIATTLYSVGGTWSSYLKGMKCVLKLLGVCDDVLAEPFTAFGPAERDRIAGHLRELGVELPADAPAMS